MDSLKELSRKVNLKSYWFFGAVTTWTILWFSANVVMHSFVAEHEFLKLSPQSISHQKSCLESFLNVFRSNKIPIILFDIDIIQELFQHKSKSWHNADHECKTICKIHPKDQNLISFAIQGSHFYEKEDRVLESLRLLKFVVHLV